MPEMRPSAGQQDSSKYTCDAAAARFQLQVATTGWQCKSLRIRCCMDASDILCTASDSNRHMCQGVHDPLLSAIHSARAAI